MPKKHPNNAPYTSVEKKEGTNRKLQESLEHVLKELENIRADVSRNRELIDSKEKKTPKNLSSAEALLYRIKI